MAIVTVTTAPYKHTVQHLSIAAFMLLISYFVFFGMTIMNTLERQNLEARLSESVPVIAELEFKYLTLKSAITLEVAKEKGFVEASDVIVTRKIQKDKVSLKQE